MHSILFLYILFLYILLLLFLVIFNFKSDCCPLWDSNLVSYAPKADTLSTKLPVIDIEACYLVSLIGQAWSVAWCVAEAAALVAAAPLSDRWLYLYGRMNLMLEIECYYLFAEEIRMPSEDRTTTPLGEHWTNSQSANTDRTMAEGHVCLVAWTAATAAAAAVAALLSVWKSISCSI